MSQCSFCGGTLQKTPDGNLKCVGCGTKYHFRTKSPILNRAQPQPQNQAQTPKPQKPLVAQVSLEQEVTPDQTTFINRLAAKLCPLEGLDPAAQKRALTVQERYKHELREVFLGKKDWNKWFDQKRTERGLHTTIFARMIIESLEGLRSPEAQSLQKQYSEALIRLNR